MKKYLGLTAAALMLVPSAALADWTIIHAGEAMLVAGESVRETYRSSFMTSAFRKSVTGLLELATLRQVKRRLRSLICQPSLYCPGLLTAMCI